MARTLEWIPRPFMKASDWTGLSPSWSTSSSLGYNCDLSRLTSSSPLTLAALRLWYRNPYIGFIHTLRVATGALVYPTPTGSSSCPCGHAQLAYYLHLSSFTKQLFLSSQIHRPYNEFERLVLPPGYVLTSTFIPILFNSSPYTWWPPTLHQDVVCTHLEKEFSRVGLADLI